MDDIVESVLDQCTYRQFDARSTIPGMRTYYAFDEEQVDDLEMTPIAYQAPTIGVPLPNAWSETEDAHVLSPDWDNAELHGYLGVEMLAEDVVHEEEDNCSDTYDGNLLENVAVDELTAAELRDLDMQLGG